MNEEEIIKQYANGIVNADEVIKSLIDKFKIDKASVDIQQLQLIAEYLIYKADKLQKENKKYIDIFNSTEKIMNKQERTKDKLLKENVELQKENKELKEQRKELNLENQALYESIKLEDSEYLAKKYQKLKENSISKDTIRNKIKEMQIEKINGFHKTYIAEEVLKELLGE